MASFGDVTEPQKTDMESGLVSMNHAVGLLEPSEPRKLVSAPIPSDILSPPETATSDSSTNSSFLGYADFLAGLLGGCSGLFVGHPFDTIKVLQQTSKGQGQHSIMQCFKNTVQHEGFRGLFKGMAFPLVSVGFLNSLFFGLYGSNLRLLSNHRCGDPSAQPHYGDIFVAGVVAGGIQAIPACPIELVKVKLQTQKGKSVYKGPIDCLKKLHQSHGIRGCFHGLGATVMREIPGLSVYITSYQVMCDNLMDGETGSLPVSAMLFSGGMAGVLSWMVNIPIDVVKSHIQSDNIMRPKYHGFIHCVKTLFREEGILVFWRGLPVTCIRAFPVNAVTFGVYTSTLQYMQMNTHLPDN